MRCAWLIYGPLHQPTGGYVYDRWVVDGLRQAGHDVDVFDLSAQDATPRVREAVRAASYDCVVGDELCHPELAVLFEQWRAHRGTSRAPKLVLLVHHLKASETGVFEPSERLALERCDCVIATSQTTALQVKHWANQTCIVCLPGADRLARLPRIQRDPSEGLRLLFVGTWTERKGLLRAIGYLRRLRDEKFRLDVVGDATRESHYTAAVWALLVSEPWLRQRTRVHGVLSEDELAEVYACADLLMLPSSYEGYGMVLTEALHAGVAVLAADVGATSEVVRCGRDGVLLPADDAERWVHELRQLANDPARVERWRCEPRQLPTWAETVGDFAQAILQP